MSKHMQPEQIQLYRAAYARMKVNGPMNRYALANALGCSIRDLAGRLANFESLGLRIWEGEGKYGAL